MSATVNRTSNALPLKLNNDSAAASSGESTPEPPAPFIPKYEVNISDRVTKDGKNVKFAIYVTENGKPVSSIERIYEDFEYLEHCVVTDQPSDGVIIPPLPLQVAVDAQSAEAQSKKQMGKRSKTLLGDDFSKEGLQLQRYVEMLLAHPILGKSPRLQSFLLNTDAPPRTKIRKGIIDKLSGSLDSFKSTSIDCEDFFQKERQWVALYSTAIDNFSRDFSEQVFSQFRVSRQLESMVVALRLNNCLGLACGTNGDGCGADSNLTSTFLETVDSYRTHLEKKCLLDELHTGSTIQLWAAYVHSESNMLLRRTALMVEYQTCNRALDKAKPNRKEAAEKAKKEAEEAFERCNDVARGEIKRFHHKRTIELQTLLQNFTQRQLASAKYCLSSLLAIQARLKPIRNVNRGLLS